MDPEIKRYYRAADAALNRALEGLRVCEDAARFITEDYSAAAELKSLRHAVADAAKLFSPAMLLSARNVEGDENKALSESSENIRSGIYMLARANLRRAAEAVRTLEELYKLNFARALSTEDDNPFKRIRFEIYEIEKKFLSQLLKTEKTASFYGSLYAILDSGFVTNGNYALTASLMIEGGARVIQLRMKDSSQRDKLKAALEIAPVCREAGAVFIVNDDPSIALLSGADGVHLGRHDIPCESASGLLFYDSLIGTSNDSVEAARESVSKGVSYIAAGPVFTTGTKTGDRLAGRGADLIKKARAETELPLVAIGGITHENAAEVIRAGADSLAVISALYKDGNIRENCEKFVRIIANEYKKKPS